MHGLLHISCFCYYNQPFIHFRQIFHSNNFSVLLQRSTYICLLAGLLISSCRYVVAYLCRYFPNEYLYFNFFGSFLNYVIRQIGLLLKSSSCSSAASCIRSRVSTPTPFSPLTKPVHTQKKASLVHFGSPLKILQ